MLTFIKEFLFGKRTENVEPFKPGCTTTCQAPFNTYGEWCKEFRVGMMHGKKAVEIPHVPNLKSEDVKN